MDLNNRRAGKASGSSSASSSQAKRERLYQLALETIDLAKDPYFMKNHLGSYECKLCLTLHNSEGSYLAHTQARKHQENLGRRVAAANEMKPAVPLKKLNVEFKKFVKIGQPGYTVTKQKDPETGQQSMLFEIDYPKIVSNVQPMYRFMSTFEQKVEVPNRKWQYLLFAAEPYDTIAFKVPNREIDKSDKKFWTLWNSDTKQFFLQFAFKIEENTTVSQNVIEASLFPAPVPPIPPPALILSMMAPENSNNKIT